MALIGVGVVCSVVVLCVVVVFRRVAVCGCVSVVLWCSGFPLVFCVGVGCCGLLFGLLWCYVCGVDLLIIV